MNKKGFTVIELMAVLVVLGLVLSITIYSISSLFKSTKEKTEDIFVSTIIDALDMYLASDAKDLSGWGNCTNALNKPTLGSRSVEYITVSFADVIKSGSLTQNDLVNPANEENACENANNISINIYKDDDFVYYYSVNRDAFGCLNNNVGTISNLPEGFKCK